VPFVLRSSLSQWLIIGLCALLPLCVAINACDAHASSSRDGFSLVAAAVAAKNTISFQGRQEIQIISSKTVRGSKMPAQIVADVVQSGPVSRLKYKEPPQASGRVVMDDGHSICQWDAQHPLILTMPSHEESPSTQRRMLRLLRQNYLFTEWGRQRVCALWCEKVDIRPRPGHTGLRQTLWIETTHHAILRTAEYSAAGALQSLSFYTQFHYLSQAPRDVSHLPAGWKTRWIGPKEVREPSFSQAFTEARVTGRLPCWLPAGYALVSCSVLTHSGKRHSVALHFGDGLQMVTLIESPARKASPSHAAHLRPTKTWKDQELWAGSLHLTLLTDPALPSGFSKDLMSALDPQTEAEIQQAISHTFGAEAARQAQSLRTRGWGYDVIIARCLLPNAHRQRSSRHGGARISPLSIRHERQARQWIAENMKTR
jgi:hypothetical protein